MADRTADVYIDPASPQEVVEQEVQSMLGELGIHADRITIEVKICLL